jgi:PAS domain S-box-containing protein
MNGDRRTMKTLWKPLCIVTGLLLLLTYLLAQSRSPDLMLRARMQERLQTLALYDAEVTRDVLLARAGLLPNYDSLTQTAPKLRETIHALRQESAAVSSDAAREIGPHVDSLARILHEKLILVEYFKSDNALLRNSSTYFAHAGSMLGGGPGAEGPAPAAEITTLSQAMLRLMQSPEGTAGLEARRALDRLSRAPTLSAGGEALATHGQLIVEMLPEVDALLRDIVAAPIPARAEGLQDVVLRHSSRIEARAQVFRILLYLVAVVLVGYVLYQFSRRRASARALRRANRNLERQIAERRQAAAALRTSEERFRAITESANDAIVSADLGGRIVSWNAKAEVIFGYRIDEILGRSLVHLMPQRYHRLREARFAERAAARVFRLAGRTVEFNGRRKDGSEFPLEISLSTWSTAHGHYVTGMIRDLSARKQLEEITRQQELQLIQANKMTTLGTLVSGVAHEINSPNQLVLMNAGVLSHAWGDALKILDSRYQEDDDLALAGLAYPEMRDTIPVLLQEVHDGARRIERIVGDLKDFARPPAGGTRNAFVLNDAVQQALRLLAHSIQTRTCRFELSLASDVPMIEGDVQQIEQVVVNLVTNALEALPGRDRGVCVRTAFDPGERAVVLEVRDEGVGIPAEHLARVCDPFFTTKRESGGTGLGLAITTSLVRGHGGRLTFSSEPGRGTRAVVTIPLPGAGGQPDSPGAASPDAEELPGSWPT